MVTPWSSSAARFAHQVHDREQGVHLSDGAQNAMDPELDGLSVESRVQHVGKPIAIRERTNLHQASRHLNGQSYQRILSDAS
jgi:hypothetical protein